MPGWLRPWISALETAAGITFKTTPPRVIESPLSEITIADDTQFRAFGSVDNEHLT